MLSWAFFISPAHRPILSSGSRLTARARPCIDRFKACRLHGIGIALVRRGIKFVLGERRLEDDLLMLRQFRLAANAAILIASLVL